MPNSVRGFLQPYLHLWHLLISWRLQVLSSRRLRRLLQTIADYNAIFDSDFFVNTNLLQQASPSSLFHQNIICHIRQQEHDQIQNNKSNQNLQLHTDRNIFICGATRAIIPSTQFKTIIQAKTEENPKPYDE